MSVVLRCPSCGTTQGHAGECEACFEGEVRYFCTNHDEGVWIDGPVCSRCGARFGDAPRRPSAPPPIRPTRPAGPPDFRSPGARRAPERPAPESGWRPPSRREPEEPEVLPRRSSLEELLEEFRTTRGGGGGGARYDPGIRWPEPRAPRPGFPIAGCLVRLVSLGFLLLVLFIIFMFVLFGGLFSGFVG